MIMEPKQKYKTHTKHFIKKRFDEVKMYYNQSIGKNPVTRKSLAEYLNIPESTLKSYIRECRMPESVLDKICKLLNVAPEYLTGEIDKCANWGDETHPDSELIPAYWFHEGKDKNTIDLTKQYIMALGYSPLWSDSPENQRALTHIPVELLALLTLDIQDLIRDRMDKYLDSAIEQDHLDKNKTND